MSNTSNPNNPTSVPDPNNPTSVPDPNNPTSVPDPNGTSPTPGIGDTLSNIGSSLMDKGAALAGDLASGVREWAFGETNSGQDEPEKGKTSGQSYEASMQDLCDTFAETVSETNGALNDFLGQKIGNFLFSSDDSDSISGPGDSGSSVNNDESENQNRNDNDGETAAASEVASTPLTPFSTTFSPDAAIQQLSTTDTSSLDRAAAPTPAPSQSNGENMDISRVSTTTPSPR